MGQQPGTNVTDKWKLYQRPRVVESGVRSTCICEAETRAIDLTRQRSKVKGLRSKVRFDPCDALARYERTLTFFLVGHKVVPNLFHE